MHRDRIAMSPRRPGIAFDRTWGATSSNAFGDCMIGGALRRAAPRDEKRRRRPMGERHEKMLATILAS
ncbi:hypothetical protein [Burkholderia thailandensis]|uniref:hypothetical protein n=1 Tax=Burkholderia thailandensis TaxID=57975 RepID=UPI00016A91A8|nr:hypothetical protein [Burkholderia thailandensis]MBS2130935.1 hypothetical protein [Burkholderia thailandensis]MCS6470599.1 hypothetical protein [Burkholderia thailandensis]MCS6477699.1 hypothetical protein [Burkholderia thailandensis]MCS6494142.1 hypothetical protein [Burkholderia thailandensis]MCS6507846.1 hypothetical protein [Burkholderia thailandensis]